jgi:hypothetical protein
MRQPVSDPQIDPTDAQEATTAPRRHRTYISPSDVPTSHNKSKYSPKGIPLSLILEYANKQLSSTEIATLVGCDHTNVIRRLNRAQPHVKGLQSFKDKRADIMALVQSKAIDNITDDKLKKASARDLTLITGILYDKERLERGQSTDNINVLSLSADIGEITKQKDELHKKLADMTGTHDVPVDK